MTWEGQNKNVNNCQVRWTVAAGGGRVREEKLKMVKC